VRLLRLEKQPAKRYQTAEEVARELRRFLDGEAIQARPIGRLERSWRWVRRHPQVASLSALLAIVMIAATAISTWQAIRARNAERQVIVERDQVLAQKKEAEAQHKRAEENFLRARVAVKDILTDAAAGSGAWSQMPPSLRQRFAERTFNFYQSFLGENISDPSLQYEMAVGLRSLASVHNSFQNHQEAEKLIRQSIEILDKLNVQHPTKVDYRRQLGWSHYVLGTTMHRQKRLADAENTLQTAISVYLKLIDEVSDAGSVSELKNCYSEFLRVRQFKVNPSFMDPYIVVCRNAAAQNDNPAQKAKIYALLGWGLAMKGESAEGVDAYEEALRLDPDNFTDYYDFGNALWDAGLVEKAIDAHREGIRVNPENSDVLNSLSWRLATFPEAKFRDPPLAVELAERAVALAPKNHGFWNTLGVARYRAGQWAAAIEALNKSIELRKEGHPEDWLFIAMAEWQLGNKGAARAFYDKSIEWIEQRNNTGEELERFRAEAAELLGIAESPM
jgi:tetratricopeptide (TPR) repeat protein